MKYNLKLNIFEIGVKNQNLVSKCIDLALFWEAKKLMEIDGILNLILKDENSSDYYIWHTVGDDKVRASHAENDGRVFSWKNPPLIGNPGEEYGCRCEAIPLTQDKPIVLSRTPSQVSTYFPNGKVVTRIGGSRAWRNNNPGNIRTGAFTNSHGAIGEAGGFAVFPDERTGQSASVALLRTSTYSKLTIDDAIARRSPSAENNTRKLQQDIRKIGGFSGKEIVGLLNNSEMGRLVSAIQRTEGWIVGKIVSTPPPE